MVAASNFNLNKVLAIPALSLMLNTLTGVRFHSLIEP